MFIVLTAVLLLSWIKKKKNYLYPRMTYRGWKKQLWNSPFKISYRFYKAAPKPQHFSTSDFLLIPRMIRETNSTFWHPKLEVLGKIVCVYGSVQWGPAYSGYLLIRGESEPVRFRTLCKFPLNFLWGICLQRKICFWRAAADIIELSSLGYLFLRLYINYEHYYDTITSK